MTTQPRVQEFLDAVVESVRHTLSVSAGTEVSQGKLFLRKDQLPMVPEVAAVIGVVSAPFTGALILGFSKPAFLAVMSRMIGGQYSDVTDEIQDGAAELLNIILGQAKILLNKRGFEIKQAIPTVVRGKDIRLGPPSGKPSLVIPFSFSEGEFYIELTTNTENEGA